MRRVFALPGGRVLPLGATVLMCTMAGACLNLDVAAIQPTAGTTYTRDSVLKDPILMEAAIASSFIPFWAAINNEKPNVYLSVLGEEITTSVQEYSILADFDSRIWDVVSEPRGPFNNEVDGGIRLGRMPWGFLYEANSAAAEIGGFIKRNNVRVIDPVTGNDNTIRLRSFAKFMMGISHTHLGILFDSAAIVNEDVDLTVPSVLPLHHYTEVLDSAIQWLEESIELAESSPFVLPLNRHLWIYQTGVSSAQLAQIAHSYIARALAYGARTPDEVVDWERVKFHVARGITSPFGPRGRPTTDINFVYKMAMTNAPNNTTQICGGLCGVITEAGTTTAGAGFFRVDYRLLGPADSSGSYQAWLLKASQPDFKTAAPFNILSADKRIQVPLDSTPSLSAPVFFKHTTQMPTNIQWDTAGRGSYYISFYWNSTRARDNRTQLPATGGGRNRRNNNDLDFVQDDMMVPAEMDFLMAEAEYRTGNLQAAAILINKTRRDNGELPDVTVDGVPDENSCVPKRYDGTCGDLWDALMYEKRIETYATGISFYDLRRWGCLLEGTWTQLPVPGQQLLLMNSPRYTFGGEPGQPGSASKPVNCPIMHRPS